MSNVFCLLLIALKMKELSIMAYQDKLNKTNFFGLIDQTH